MTCSVEGCAATHRAKGLCNAHYKRLRRVGELRAEQPVQITRDDVSRFWTWVEKTDACWLWHGTKTLHGYGRFTTRSVGQMQAHRYAYEISMGPIPEGAELDHLCRVRHCVRPEHLEPVSHRENVIRGHTARRLARVGGQ